MVPDVHFDCVNFWWRWCLELTLTVEYIFSKTFHISYAVVSPTMCLSWVSSIPKPMVDMAWRLSVIHLGVISVGLGFSVTLPINLPYKEEKTSSVANDRNSSNLASEIHALWNRYDRLKYSLPYQEKFFSVTAQPNVVTAQPNRLLTTNFKLIN